MKFKSIYSKTNGFTVPLCSYFSSFYMQWGFPGGSDGKVSACKEEDLGSISGSGRSPGEGNGTTPVFLPGESHGQRSLVGYSP